MAPDDQHKTYGRTKSGRAITEAVIAEAVAEAEAGYELDDIRIRPQPGLPAETGELAVNLDPAVRLRLQARADRDATTLDEVINRALKDYLQAS